MDRFSPQNQVLDAKRWGLVILFFQVLHSQAQNIPVANPERLQQVTVTGNASDDGTAGIGSEITAGHARGMDGDLLREGLWVTQLPFSSSRMEKP